MQTKEKKIARSSNRCVSSVALCHVFPVTMIQTALSLRSSFLFDSANVLFILLSDVDSNKLPQVFAIDFHFFLVLAPSFERTNICAISTAARRKSNRRTNNKTFYLLQSKDIKRITLIWSFNLHFPNYED